MDGQITSISINLQLRILFLATAPLPRFGAWHTLMLEHAGKLFFHFRQSRPLRCRRRRRRGNCHIPPPFHACSWFRSV